LFYISHTKAKCEGADVVLTHNAGWTKNGYGLASLFFPANPSAKSLKGAYGTYADPTKNPPSAKLFDGHNLIANPHFSLAEAKEKRPVGWRSITDLEGKKPLSGKIFQRMLAGSAKVHLDNKQYRSAPSALCIEKTKGVFGLTGTFQWVDFHKRQRLSAWVKTNNLQGTIRLETYWFAWDYVRGQLDLPYLKLLRVDQSAPLEGDHNWTELAVDTQPPIDGIVVASVIRDESTDGQC
jgi:hypothetical protein